MQRKDPVTAVEILADKLAERGHKVEWIRQPVPPEPGFVTFSNPSSPSQIVKINVVERFLELYDELIEKIAEAERQLEAEKNACRKDTSREMDEPEDGSYS